MYESLCGHMFILCFIWIWYVSPKSHLLKLGLHLGATHRLWKFWAVRPRAPLVTEDIPLKGTAEGSSLLTLFVLWLTMRGLVLVCLISPP